MNSGCPEVVENRFHERPNRIKSPTHFGAGLVGAAVLARRQGVDAGGRRRAEEFRLDVDVAGRRQRHQRRARFVGHLQKKKPFDDVIAESWWGTRETGSYFFLFSP